MLEVRRRADPATQNGHWEKGALGLGSAVGRLRMTALADPRAAMGRRHGLLRSEAEMLGASKGELALLLTPPNQPSREDDGLLTASEAALLKPDDVAANGRAALRPDPLCGQFGCSLAGRRRDA